MEHFPDGTVEVHGPEVGIHWIKQVIVDQIPRSVLSKKNDDDDEDEGDDDDDDDDDESASASAKKVCDVKTGVTKCCQCRSGEIKGHDLCCVHTSLSLDPPSPPPCVCVWVSALMIFFTFISDHVVSDLGEMAVNLGDYSRSVHNHLL